MIGSTTKPWAEIKKGYSLVPCADPRYLTTRRRRVEISALHPMVEHDHAVGDVLLDPVPGEATVAPLPGHDRGDAPVLEPARQPASSDRTIASSPNAPNSTSMVSSTTRFAPPARSCRRGSQTAVRGQIPPSRRLGGLHPEREHHEQAVPLELVEVEAERAHVEGDLVRRLLEGHQHAGLAVLAGAGDQELQPQQRLARSRAARHQRQPAQGSPPPVIWSSPRIPVGAFGNRGPTAASASAEIGSAMIGRLYPFQRRFQSPSLSAAG